MLQDQESARAFPTLWAVGHLRPEPMSPDGEWIDDSTRGQLLGKLRVKRQDGWIEVHTSVMPMCGVAEVCQGVGEKEVQGEAFRCKRHNKPSRPISGLVSRTWTTCGTLQRLQLEWAAGEEPVLAPGATVKGELLVAVREGWITFHSLNVVLLGQIRVRHGFKGHKSEIFKSSKRQLLGCGCKCEVSCMLIAGDHTFDFALVLPSDDLDTSMESKNCAIRYLVEAELVLSHGARYVARRAFTVIGHVNATTNISQSRVERSNEKCANLWPLRSATCRVRASSDKTFYFPGESASLEAVISSGCSRQVWVSASLIQLETVMVNCKKFASRTKLATFKTESCLVKAGKEVEWRGQTLRVPPTCPSFDNNHIKVEYSVEVRITFFNRELLVVSVPIVIVAVPAPSSISGPVGSTSASVSDLPGYWSCLKGVNVHYLSAGIPNTDWDVADFGLDRFLPLYGYIATPTNQDEHDEALPSYVQATSLQEGQTVAIPSESA